MAHYRECLHEVIFPPPGGDIWSVRQKDTLLWELDLFPIAGSYESPRCMVLRSIFQCLRNDGAHSLAQFPTLFRVVEGNDELVHFLIKSLTGLLGKGVPYFMSTRAEARGYRRGGGSCSTPELRPHVRNRKPE